MQAEVLDVPSTGSQLESLWMRFVGGTVFIVGVLYRPPRSPISPVLDDLNYQLTSQLAKQHPLYVLGDVNIDLLQPTSTGVQQYQTLLDELSLCQVISTPTRTTPSTATLIDHVVTSRPELTSHPRVIDCSFSDHDAVAVNISIKRARQRAQTITVRSTRRVDWDGLNFDLLTL
ncbi:hypothetical protein FJT64_000786 [Amphibalanus amphitrite]|uniref:Uncharacterized protein n=1 Tax=Amphibalanus amphitrite TaxID=1232801 RepID=A0A6A4VLW1_AMPAM|nr:hypothetical protein FJT64_000786 [Amphibalanus amphitrite]